MVGTKINYKAFNTVILRTPLLPLNFLSSFDTIRKQLFFNEALYFASIEIEEQNRLENIRSKADLAIFRYFERACTRPTPFAMFAGISVLKLGEKTNIDLKDINNYKLFVRPDMTIIYSLIHRLLKIKQIREKLLYSSNNSIYKVCNKIRFVEYQYKKNQRAYHLSSTDAHKYLMDLIAYAKRRRTFGELVSFLVDKGYSYEESESFVHELIESQILISNIEPSITNINCIIELLSFLKTIKKTEAIAIELENIINTLNNFNKIGKCDSLSNLKIVTDILRKLEFKSKSLYQCDMLKPVLNGTVSKKVVADIEQALILLNRFTFGIKNNHLKNFKDEFLRRYEDREMPFLFVLDQETGIGYETGNYNEGISSLVDDLIMPVTSTDIIELGSVSTFLLKRVEVALKEDKKEINLTDNEVASFNLNWDDLPKTFSVICNIIGENEEEQKIFIKAVGGSSAANLLSRFCHLDGNLHNFVNEIVDIEDYVRPNIIIAEIVHMPEDRTMNILLRPNLRKYEIPYLSNSGVSSECQIEPSDLMISIRNHQIRLRSKKFNKIVYPILTSAHDYSSNSLPVYKFLCDLQHQENRSGLAINLSSVKKLYDFIPRIGYKNCILSRACWTVNEIVIKKWRSGSNSELLIYIDEWRSQMNVPRKVVLIDKDNELYIDFNCLYSIKSLIEVTKNNNRFYLEEFLFEDEHANVAVENSNNEIFTNEFIFSFYKDLSK